MLYLDRLRRNPVSWGVFPRMKAWTKEDINLAKKEDRKAAGDYGGLGVSSLYIIMCNFFSMKE